MKLTEVFTKPKGKITWVKRSPKKYAARFSVGEDRIFEFMAVLGWTTEHQVHPLNIPLKKVWEVDFVQIKPTMDWDITGKGKPVEVMNKVLVAFKEFAKMAKPEYVTFTAKESSRMKLYNIMVKKLARGLGFKILIAQQGTYVLQGKRIK